MRAILVSVVVLILATACAGTGGSTSGTAPKATAETTPQATTDTTPQATAIDTALLTPEYVASLPRDQADEAIRLLTRRYLRLALGPCSVPVDACFNEQLQVTFDQSGELAALCKVNGTGFEYQLCMLSAPVTVPMVAAAGGNPATDIDWSNVDSTNNAARRQFGEFIINKKCSGDPRCFVDQAVTLLGLSPTVATSCQLQVSLSDQMNCVSTAQAAEVYQRALRSLS